MNATLRMCAKTTFELAGAKGIETLAKGLDTKVDNVSVDAQQVVSYITDTRGHKAIGATCLFSGHLALIWVKVDPGVPTDVFERVCRVILKLQTEPKLTLLDIRALRATVRITVNDYIRVGGYLKEHEYDRFRLWVTHSKGLRLSRYSEGNQSILTLHVLCADGKERKIEIR